MSRLKKATVGLTVAGTLAVSVVSGFEGVSLKAYVPVKGDVPTVCFGHTRGVKMGDTYTLAQCKAMLGDDLIKYETDMRAALRAPDSIPDKPYVAFLSLSYNIGPSAFKSSTVARKINSGDLRGACNAILMWDKFKGRALPGLTKRRQEERKLCLEGL